MQVEEPRQRMFYLSRLMKGWEVQEACRRYFEREQEKAKEKADSAGTLSA